MDQNISTSFGTIRALHLPPLVPDSRPESPVSALPSPPDSPSAGSISSLPSMSSSFFFSSGPASPHHQPFSRDETDDLRLVIPSLTLPSSLPHATAYGQTLGDLRLLLLGGKGVGKTTLANLLLEGNDEVVEISGWEYLDEQARANVLRASTDWIEHADAHGLEKFEPARNVEIVELPGYDHQLEVSALIQTALSLIHSPFETMEETLNPDQPPSPMLANLLSSPHTPFYTALVLLLTSTPSPTEYALIESLSPHIPIIVLPSLPSRNNFHLSSFRPSTSAALQSGLFRSPETLATLRSEAADRFLRWREVRRALSSSISQSAKHTEPSTSVRWNKAEWEAEWDYKLSKDVARHRRSTITPSSPSCRPPSFDPLHLPSIFMFSLSLLAPLRSRIFGSGPTISSRRHHKVPSWVFAAGAFCVGIGIGLVFS